MQPNKHYKNVVKWGYKVHLVTIKQLTKKYSSTQLDISQYFYTQLYMKINQLNISDNRLLQRLVHIPSCPKLLYCIGNLPDEMVKTVSIVGSRKPTIYGRTVTQQIASRLAEKNATIISGMALGIDAIAHRAAIEAGGKTIAVLPSGVDDPYPKTNQELARNILFTGGALISEFENGHQPHSYDFLSRNRIVSGLADAVVVTEANIRSGTLSTVAHALAQGRDVYAVPGPITSPLSAGCNKLIAQGATPIIDIESFLDQLGLNTTKKKTPRGDTAEEQTIIDLIVSGVGDGDELVVQSELEQSTVSTALTMLELKGSITALGNNQWGI